MCSCSFVVVFSCCAQHEGSRAHTRFTPSQPNQTQRKLKSESKDPHYAKGFSRPNEPIDLHIGLSVSQSGREGGGGRREGVEHLANSRAAPELMLILLRRDACTRWVGDDYHINDNTNRECYRCCWWFCWWWCQSSHVINCRAVTIPESSELRGKPMISANQTWETAPMTLEQQQQQAGKYRSYPCKRVD